LRRCLNITSDGADVTCGGRLFQKLAPETRNTEYTVLSLYRFRAGFSWWEAWGPAELWATADLEMKYGEQNQGIWGTEVPPAGSRGRASVGVWGKAPRS